MTKIVPFKVCHGAAIRSLRVECKPDDKVDAFLDALSDGGMTILQDARPVVCGGFFVLDSGVLELRMMWANRKVRSLKEVIRACQAIMAALPSGRRVCAAVDVSIDKCRRLAEVFDFTHTDDYLGYAIYSRTT